jgi:DNA-binding CsgD family transcriptional regulator
MSAPSVIDVVESAYCLQDDDNGWLKGILDTSAPHLFAGMGGVAALFDARATDPQNILRSIIVSGADLRILAAMRVEFEQGSGPDRDKSLKNPSPVMCLSDFIGDSPAKHPAYAEIARATGFQDVLVVRASNADGTGVVLSAVLPHELRHKAECKQRWSRVAAHVAAGMRLQRAARRAVASDGDAVLTPTGKVLHAAPTTQPAREVLRRAAIGMDRARTTLRQKDAAAALEAWSALVDGRWSLIDRFESDGKRFVVAMPNAPTARDPRALGEVERPLLQYVAMGHPNKLIAYELGLPEGTISARIASIKRKLGVRSRAELVTACMASETRDHLEIDFAGETLHVLVERVASLRGGSAWDRLTSAEREVAELAIGGATSRGIASKRRCSRRTVENLLAHVFKKLGLASRGDLAAHAASSANGPSQS